ncbi:MAG: hypothetical protein ABMA13_18290 [Chthoniobacteraceae bacterium]
MHRLLFIVFAFAACSRPLPPSLQLEPLAVVGAGLGGEFAGGDAGPPCAVAADDRAVFLGWRSARLGHEIVACEPGGRVLWGHHHGPAMSGVRSLAADGGAVFVLADADGTKLYRLDAATGAPIAWEGRDARDLAITSLWGDDKTKLDRADALAADNGRLYVTFSEEQFVAVLDAKTGAYLTTLTGPHPGQMSFSTTPMRDPQTGVERPIDFGVAAIAGHGLAYFLMEHEPPWVMMSTTRWLQPDEKIGALTLVGDAMKTSKLTIYTALGAPHHQVQLRPAEAAESFATSVGKGGGRIEPGPWEPEALRDIRALAVDATGQLWIAEGDEHFGRFTVWKTDGKQGALVREIFGPLDAATLHVDEAEPLDIALGGLRWRIEGRTATCVERLAGSPDPSRAPAELRDKTGRVLWAPPESERAAWSVHRAGDGRVFAFRRGAGVEVFALREP